MLSLLLVAAATYLLYVWGIRLQIRAQLSGSWWLERCATACSLLTGTVVSLFVTLNWIVPYWHTASPWEVSLLSTVFAIVSGESLSARTTRLSLRLLAPMRSKEQER